MIKIVRFKTNEMVKASLLLAFGILLPIATHGFVPGTVLLPMHIPVLLAAYILPLNYAVIISALIPIISSILTGMPPAFPVLPFMIFELTTYAAVTFLLYKHYKSVYISLIVGMISGRLVASVVVWFMATFLMAKLPDPITFIIGGLSQGIIGLMVQLTLIPAIVIALRKSRFIE